MSLILDIILIAILVAFIASAVKKGFMLSLLELVAVIAALALAFSFSPVVAQGVYDGVVENVMIEALEEQIDQNVNASDIAENAELTLSVLPEFIVSLAENAGVDVAKIKDTIATADLSSENLATELVTKVAEPITVGVLTAVFFIILAILLVFVLKIVAKLLSKAFDLPLVGKVNKTLGGILGAIKGIVVLVFICTILNFALSNGDGELSTAVNESFVINILDYINPFINSLKEML